MNKSTYIGNELELFSAASVWKHYVHRHLTPYLGCEVLEVGAGLGGSTRVFCREHHRRWVCLEPDAALLSQVQRSVDQGELPSCCITRLGVTSDLDDTEVFDTLLYTDVLEHIEDDHAELAHAGRFVRLGGYIVVLCPAHNWLFTPFDRAIGHYRRYDRPMYTALTPPGFKLVLLRYLDTVGLMASISNRLFLRQSMPTPAQIRFWDRVMVPASKLIDPILSYNFGKSILGVWRKRSES